MTEIDDDHAINKVHHKIHVVLDEKDLLGVIANLLQLSPTPEPRRFGVNQNERNAFCSEIGRRLCREQPPDVTAASQAVIAITRISDGGPAELAGDGFRELARECCAKRDTIGVAQFRAGREKRSILVRYCATNMETGARQCLETWGQKLIRPDFESGGRETNEVYEYRSA